MIEDLSRALDGFPVFGVRYPNASSTSHELKTLRVYINPPASAVFIPVETLVRKHQGDCDGDRFGWHVCLENVPEFTSESSPLFWRRRYSTAHNTLNLDELDAPPTKTPMEIMDGFSERGKWVGMLTYNFWLLAYACSFWHHEMGFENRADVVPVILDLFTPLIEGVMNARKGTGAGSIGAESLASMVCDMFTGQKEIDEVLSLLPVNRSGEYDEEKFTGNQIQFLSRLLHLIGGRDEMGEPSKICRLNNTETGACQDPVLVSFQNRFKKDGMTYLLGALHPGWDFFDVVMKSLLMDHKVEFPQGVRPNVFRLMGEPDDMTDPDEY